MNQPGTSAAIPQWHMGGEIPGAPGVAAFAQADRHPSPLPILIAVPHAGRHYPEDLTRKMRLPAEASLRLEDRLVDLLAEGVAAATGASLIVAHAPRALIDLNRASDDVDWDMIAGGAPLVRPKLAAGRRSRSGLGLVPRRLQGSGEIWRTRITPADLSARIDMVHRPYHQALGEAFEALRDRWGRALLIDLHSMPPLGPLTGPDAAASFVVGDRFGASCDSTLANAALDHLRESGRRAAHNRPYAGGYVLDRHGAPARGLHAVQMEVCRSAYLDARLSEPGPGMADTVEVLTGLVQRLASELNAMPTWFAQAAE
jgi:N-formylglutamate amidohydrolase